MPLVVSQMDLVPLYGDCAFLADWPGVPSSAVSGSFGALGGGTLGAQLGEQIAVADRSRCDYCLSAHTLLGKKAGATTEELADAQRGYSHDPKTAAVLALATAIVGNRGQIDDSTVQNASDSGLTSEEIVETIAHVALNVFTNNINVALDVRVDFEREASPSAA
ncbi:hypothetical protein AN219_01365 [Streptomyces nanshensis]|nr:hypothetical protein AN219_01365 [Streptomyces nanshensis]